MERIPNSSSPSPSAPASQSALRPPVAGGTIVIKLGGMSYTLTKEDYTINDAGQCLFAMTGLDVRAPPPAHTPEPIARATCICAHASLTVACVHDCGVCPVCATTGEQHQGPRPGVRHRPL